MKIGKMQVYNLIGGVATAAVVGLGVNCSNNREADYKKRNDAIEYLKKYAPKEYESTSTYIDTTFSKNSQVIDKTWINTAKRVQDSLQMQTK